MLVEGINTHNNEFGMGISDIPVMGCQRIYKGIKNSIVFMNIGPNSFEKENVKLGGKEDYYNRGEQIFRVVKSMTGRILNRENSVFFIDALRQDYAKACETIANGANINNPLIIESKLFRTRIAEYKQDFRQKINHLLRMKVEEQTLAVIIMVHKRLFSSVAIEAGYKYKDGDRGPRQIIIDGGIDENKMLYFPFKP